MPSADRPALLEVEDLTVSVRTRAGDQLAVRGIDLRVDEGETVALVGESGSGKTLAALAIAGLLPRGARASGRVMFQGRDLLAASERTLRRIRGNDLAVVFQDSLAALNPTMSVGQQIAESRWAHHRGESRAQRRTAAVEALRTVHVPAPATRAGQYPHEFSGGMRQRAMIAMARVNTPKLLIADEPTTALDVTVQAQVLSLIDEAKRDAGVGTIFITHDLALVANIADRVAVMYAGRLVETGLVADVFDRPNHPYTAGLIASVPRLDRKATSLTSIPGSPPRLGSLEQGCRFEPRCPLGHGRALCRQTEPTPRETESAHAAACHFTEEAQAVARHGMSETRSP